MDKKEILRKIEEYELALEKLDRGKNPRICRGIQARIRELRTRL